MEAKASVGCPITKTELQKAMKDMATGKSPGPDGIILNFYITFWEIIGDYYWHMVTTSIAKGQLPMSVTKGMIALLDKGGEHTKLTNWRPIMLLNLSYKIYAKALQLRLQFVLMEVISLEKSVFLPLRFILDNLLLTQETMAWAEHSHQPLLFLKLDFSKAYDMVDWDFIFLVMASMGFPQAFINMVKLLFRDVSATVKVNGSPSSSFKIERGVRQGLPLGTLSFCYFGGCPQHHGTKGGGHR